MHTNKLQRTITLKYIVALSLIALLSTTAFFTFHTVLKQSSHTGEIVNISGKQRMLSQHIALDVHRIDATQGITSQYHILEKHISEMSQANTMLSTGVLSKSVTVVLSSKIHTMYFGEMDIANRVEEYLFLAKEVIQKSKNNLPIEELLQNIDSRSEPLLKDLDLIVKQYQLEHEMNVQQMQLLEILVWILTLFTLLLEIIFIFRPMVKQIIKVNLEKDDVLKHLEETVKTRTMHLEDANEQLNELAFKDHLTGLKNRLNLEEDIQTVIDRFHQFNAPYGVLMFDIDWFKSVNDTYGHDIGDKVLVQIADIIVSSVRKDDKVYRAGGEEFVVLLTKISYEEIIKVTEKVRSIIEAHVFEIGNETFSKTISAGLFHSSIVNVYGVKNVLKLTDTALYESKINGRNRISTVSEFVDIIEDETKVAGVTITFSDGTLSHVTSIENANENTLCCDYNALLSDKKFFIEIVHPIDFELLINMPLGITQEAPYSTTLRILTGNEKVSIYHVKAYEKESGQFVLILTESVNIKSHVSEQTHITNLQAMLQNTNDYIYFKDRNHVFTGASDTLVSITSTESREEILGKTDYDIFDKELADEYFILERQVFDGELDVAQKIQQTIDNEGNKSYVDNRKYPIHDASGNIIGLFGIARIINTERYRELLEKKI